MVCHIQGVTSTKPVCNLYAVELRTILCICAFVFSMYCTYKCAQVRSLYQLTVM